MIEDWEDLAFVADPAHKEYNELKAWLRSQTLDSETFVSNTSHPVDMLRAVLQAATHEIRDNLDEQIALMVGEAESHNIQVRQGDYYRTRRDDWDGMLPTDIDEMGMEECVGLMRAAKDEIAWLVNEISRLQFYISVEMSMEKFGLEGRATVLRPLERKGERHTEITEPEEEQDILESVDSAFEIPLRSSSVELGC